MIIGVGADLCDIRRIQTSLDRFGDRFKQRCFTDLERARTEKTATSALSEIAHDLVGDAEPVVDYDAADEDLNRAAKARRARTL